ncbi:MAG: dihydrofolate reductase family protein [Vulcanimicrobiaceae bacterium]
MSLDGFITEGTGGLAWREQCQDADYGYPQFLDSIATVVMGRKSYEFARSRSAWEYAGKRCVVLTSQLLGDLPPEVDTTPGPVRTLIEDLRDNAAGDVWIRGGAQVMGAFLDEDAVDCLEIFTVPVLLAVGTSLFERNGLPKTMRPAECHRFANGVVRTLYYRQSGERQHDADPLRLQKKNGARPSAD